MWRCAMCPTEFDPAKDFFIVVNERKGPTRNLCSLDCTVKYLADED